MAKWGPVAETLEHGNEKKKEKSEMEGGREKKKKNGDRQKKELRLAVAKSKNQVKI